MNFEFLLKYFLFKFMMFGVVLCGIMFDMLIIIDVMVFFGLFIVKVVVGIELYFVKVGVLFFENIIVYIRLLVEQCVEWYGVLWKMEEGKCLKFFDIMVCYVFCDYFFSVVSLVMCSSCYGVKLIDVEVFMNKVIYLDGKLLKWVKDMKGIFLFDWEVWKLVCEQVCVVCKVCDGKGYVKNECCCWGCGEIFDKKKFELQGVLVYKKCLRCKGRGYLCFKDIEIFKVLGVMEMVWWYNYKLFFDWLVEYCYIEELYVEKVLGNVI